MGGAAGMVSAIGTPTIGAITDGTSNTIGVVECGPPVPWTKPADLTFSDLNLVHIGLLDWPFKSARHVAMMDGSARAFSNTLPEDQFRALLTAAGGEVLPGLNQYAARLPVSAAEAKARLDNARREVTEVTAELLKAKTKAEALRIARETNTDDFYYAEECLAALKQQLQGELETIKELSPPKK